MSGICGVINFDGQPVEQNLLEQMAAAAAYRGKDGIRYWLKGGLGFVHLALHTTPESRRENQPLVHQQNGLVLVADARIDDRESLIKRIRGKNVHIHDKPTDASLILAAYMTWGTDCPGYLLGDFAFVIWDNNQRKAFAARDRGGCRSLYYRRCSNGIRFATQVSQLIVDPDYNKVLNRLLVARDLVLPGFGGQHQSYYSGIEKLAAAESFQATTESFKVRKYWQLNIPEQIVYTDSRQYSEHFRSLFRQCVRDRLRCEGETGLFLSGGLDSSCVAAMAGDEIGDNSQTVTSNLKCVNWTYGEDHIAMKTSMDNLWHQGGILILKKLVWSTFRHFIISLAKPHIVSPYNSPISSFFTATLEKFANTENSPKVWMTDFMVIYWLVDRIRFFTQI